MASASDFLEAALLDAYFGSGSPATFYVALFTAAPSDSGGGTEVSGNAYARVAVTNNGTNFTRSANVISNGVAVTFPAPTPANWGTVTHFGLFDAASAGNLYVWNALTASRLTAIGVPLSFAIGALTITAD